MELHHAANPHSEVLHAADTLRRWHEEGLAWRDMAVAMPGDEALLGLLTVTLRAAGIPFHATRKDSVRRHGLCRLLLGSVRAAAMGFSQADMLPVLRSGFTPLTDRQAMLLENYVTTHGIRGRRWREPFTWGNDAEEMERLRVPVAGPILRLQKALESAQSADDALQAVFALLQDFNAYALLDRRQKLLTEQGMPVEADRSRQVWGTVIGLMDQLHGLMPQGKPDARRLAQLLEAGLESVSISVLPPEPDCVLVGTVGNLLPGQLRGLLVLGLQDTATSVSAAELISEEERNALQEYTDRPVGLNHPNRSAKRLADYYRAISLPSERLVLSCSLSGQDGGVLHTSMIMNNAGHVLPGCLKTGGMGADRSAALPLSPRLALE